MASRARIERTEYGAFMVFGTIDGSRLASFGYTRDEAIQKWGDLMLKWMALGKRLELAEAGSGK